MKNSFLLSAAVSIILGIVLIVYPVKNKFADLLYRRSTAPVRRRCCADPLHCKPRRTVFFFRYDLFVALVLILFGCFVIFESDLVIAFIPVVIGIILLANGLAQHSEGVQPQKNRAGKMVA